VSGLPSSGHARGHHFLSYSRVDGLDFALELYDELLAGPPEVNVWLDHRKLRPGQHWSKVVEEAIRSCESFMMVLSPEAVASQSMCNNELKKALRYKKPIIPLLLA
jgi:TIR domain